MKGNKCWSCGATMVGYKYFPGQEKLVCLNCGKVVLKLRIEEID